VTLAGRTLVDLVTERLAATNDQLPEDIGKAGPLGLLLIVVLFIAVILLVRSMSKHLKRIPASFDPPAEQDVDVPDSPEGIDDPGPQPGETLLEDLRRQPRAIEPPRPSEDGRPET
jgi:hypothetical protein